MKLQAIEKKWWFFVPVMAAAVYTMYWMFAGVGIDMKVSPFSFAKMLLFFTTLFSLERFYSLILRLVLASVMPMPGDEKKVAP